MSHGLTASRLVHILALLIFGARGLAAPAPAPAAAPTAAEAPPPGAETVSAPLPTTVVTATRSPETVGGVPSSVVVIDRQALDDRQPRSLPEALRETPGILVQRTAHGQGSPFLRGFTGYQTLALIEGVRLNSSIGRSGPNQYWNTIDPYSLSNIEVLLGAGSVLYGSDAVGGTMNAFIRRPIYPEQGLGWSGKVDTRFSSAENSQVGRVEAGLAEAGKWGLTVGATAKHFGNLEAAGIPTQTRTGYDEWDLDGTFEWLFPGDTRLTIHHNQIHQDDAMRTHSTIYGVPWRGSDVGSDLRRSLDQDRWLTFAQIDGGEAALGIDEWILSLSHQRQEEAEDRIRSDTRRQVRGFTLDTLGLWGQAAGENALGRLTTGFDFYYDWVDSFRNDTDASGSSRRRIQGPVADDSNYLLAGLFAEQRIDLGDRTKVWIGGRATHASADAGRYEDPVTGMPASFDDSWSNIIGSARATFDILPDEQLVLFGGVTPAFRAPSLHDLTALSNARSDEIETPSPDLDPEEFLTAEVGLRATGDTMAASLTYYHTWIDGLITPVATGRMVEGRREVRSTNAGDGDLDGIEARMQWQPDDHWTFHAAVAWQEGSVESFPTATSGLVNEPISRLAPLTGVASVRYDSDWNWWIEALLTVAAEQDRLSSRDRGDTQRIPPGGTPGYTVATLRGGVTLVEGLDVTLAVENFTDEEYRFHGSGLNEAGINVVGGVRYRW